MLEEVYFIDKKQVHAYVVNGIKIYLDECYWQTTKQGTEKRDIKNPWRAFSGLFTDTWIYEARRGKEIHVQCLKDN